MPNDYAVLLLYLVGGFVGIWCLIAASGALPLILLWKAQVIDLDQEAAREVVTLAYENPLIEKEWLDSTSFEPVQVFQLRSHAFSPIVIGWRYRQEKTYLCAYVMQAAVIGIDLVTVLADDSLLTTTINRDGHLIPAGPRSWLQSFDARSVEELWRRHLEALGYLQRTRGVKPQAASGSLDEDVVQSFVRQKQHLQSLSLWYLRVPYWYFSRRSKRHNLSVEALIESE